MYVAESAGAAARRIGGLAADDYGTDDGRTPLVLLHGMTFDRTIWRPLVDRLQQTDPGRRMLVLDLPGHGDSPEQERATTSPRSPLSCTRPSGRPALPAR